MPRPGTKPPTKVLEILVDERIEDFSYFNEVDLWVVKILNIAIPFTLTTVEFEAYIDNELF